jgi:hypothetical protein
MVMKIKKISFCILLILTIQALSIRYSPTHRGYSIKNQVLNKNLKISSDYEKDFEVSYGIPTMISEVSAPQDNLFNYYIPMSLNIQANFSSNNGTIWIKNLANKTMWEDYTNNTIEEIIRLHNNTSRAFSLWVNSSTAGNNTIFFTFELDLAYAHNFGLPVLIVFLPIIIIFAIYMGIRTGRKYRYKY